MKRSVCKNLIMVLVLISCMLLVGCASKNEKKIIGYWMDDYANTVSFVDESNGSINNDPITYTIYDGDHLQIRGEDVYVAEHKFYFDGDDLYITPTDDINGDCVRFTKDEKEQKEILARVSKERADAEAELQRQEDIARQEAELQEKVDKLQQKIDDCQASIDDIDMRIEKNKSDIIKWEEDIEEQKIECEEAIAFGDDPDYQKSQRDDFIVADKEAIESCKRRIKELETEKVKYQEQMDELKKQLNKVMTGKY